MAISPDFERLVPTSVRPLADEIFDSLRDAVLVVDSRCKNLPLVMANAAARRCLLRDCVPYPLIDCSLYSLLGGDSESAVDLALGSLAGEKSRVTRVLAWRFPHGEIPLVTDLRALASTATQRLTMLTFADPWHESGAEPDVLAAIDQLPLDFLVLDRKLTVTYANAAAARTAGSTAGKILGHSALTVAPTSAVPREAFIGALDGHHYHGAAIPVKMPDDSTRWFEVDVRPLGQKSDIVGLAVIATQAAERRAGERRAGTQVVRGSERRLPPPSDAARDIVSIATRDGKLQHVSGGLGDSLGHAAEERRERSIFDHVHPDDVDALRVKYAELATATINAFSLQYRVLQRDGSCRWLESNYVSALDSPVINGIVVNARDITEQKQAEARQAQREEAFQLAADAVHGIIFEWDLRKGMVHSSRGVHDVLGLEPAEMQSVAAWSGRIHPLDAPGYEAKIAAALKNGRGWTTSYRIFNATGRHRTILERGLIQRNARGDPQRAIGCCVDVSEIRRLTDLLTETHRAAQMGGWEYSYTTRGLEWTDEMFSIFETTPKNFVVSWPAMLGRCVPESRLRLNAALDAAESGEGKLDLELEIVTLKERRLWVRLIGHLEILDGRPFRAFGSIQNIQVQKLAQIALENSTEWLKLSMNMAHMHAWRWTRATDSLEFAIIDGRMVNLPRVFPGMRKLLSRLHPMDRLAVRRDIDQAFERHTEVRREFRLRSHDGGYRVYAAVARPVFDAANQPSGLVGVTQDVTARHESEARLRRSDELLRTTTANTADTLLLVDPELKVRFINRGACGMSIEAIVGRELAVLLPDAARETVINKLHQVLATAEPATYEYEVRANSAETEYFENRAVLVRDDGIGTGISITMRNITERRRLEQEILDVSSRERQSIGRDLHDGLGQELTGVALMLRGLATRIQRQFPESTPQVNEIVVLVNQSIDTARALARGLLPVNTDSGGLSRALQTLADRSRDVYGFKADFQSDVADESTLNETTASHLYRIAQEALTNAARHGRASAVVISLTVAKAKFSLQITDDGVGIKEEKGSATGMGLKIMKYRASRIGATFEIASNSPHGTVVRVAGQRTAATNALESAHSI
jgi:PAS domain S-box-containing protein